MTLSPYIRCFCAIGISIILAACAGSSQVIPVDRTFQLKLPPVEKMQLPNKAVQWATFSRDEFSGNFQLVMEGGPNTQKLVVLDPIGRRVLNIDWSGESAEFRRDKAWSFDGLPPESLLAHLVMIYAPRSAFEAALGPDAQIIQTTTNRRILLNSKPYIDIHYEPRLENRWTGVVELTHIGLSYQLSIQTVLE